MQRVFALGKTPNSFTSLSRLENKFYVSICPLERVSINLRTKNLDHDCLKGCVLSGSQMNSTVTILVLFAFILAYVFDRILLTLLTITSDQRVSKPSSINLKMCPMNGRLKIRKGLET